MKLGRSFWIVGFLVVLLTAGCLEEDTCNKGATFTEMNIDTISAKPEMDLNMEINWTRGRQLPLEYFRAVQIYKSERDPRGEEWENDWKLISAFQVPGLGRFQLQLHSVAPDDSPRVLNFHFAFPDRREFINCTHPGSPDMYRLELRMEIQYGEGDRVDVTDFIWNETLVKGGI